MELYYAATHKTVGDGHKNSFMGGYMA
jgi:hypothetical protein